MRKALPLVLAVSSMLATGAAVATVPQFECTTSYHHYDVPDPTRRGPFISHFDGNSAPQSIVTTSDSDTTCTEPEPPTEQPPD